MILATSLPIKYGVSFHKSEKKTFATQCNYYKKTTFSVKQLGLKMLKGGSIGGAVGGMSAAVLPVGASAAAAFLGTLVIGLLIVVTAPISLPLIGNIAEMRGMSISAYLWQQAKTNVAEAAKEGLAFSSSVFFPAVLIGAGIGAVLAAGHYTCQLAYANWQGGAAKEVERKPENTIELMELRNGAK
ncbi:MAG: hypothetical protein AAF443_03315 [Chlamydiota bacterium]